MNTDSLVHHFALRAPSFNHNGWANNEIILSSIANGVTRFCPRVYDVLDYGAGTGEVSKYLLNKLSSDIQITALDISPEMLSRVQDERIKCIVSSVEKTPFQDSCFDLIVSRQCLHYVRDLSETLVEARRILREHGKFILTQFVPLEDETKPYWVLLTKIRQPLRANFFSEEDWIECFKKEGFSVFDVQRFSIEHSDSRIRNQSQMMNGRQKNEYLEKLIAAPDCFRRVYGVEINESRITSRSFGVTIVFGSD